MWLLIQARAAAPCRGAASSGSRSRPRWLFPVAALLSAGLMMKDYNTAVPVETFRAMAYVGIGMSAVLGFVVMERPPPPILHPSTRRRPARCARRTRRLMGIDAAAAFLAAIGIGRRAPSVAGAFDGPLSCAGDLSIGSPDIIASACPASPYSRRGAQPADECRATRTYRSALPLTAKTWMRIAGVMVALCCDGFRRYPHAWRVRPAIRDRARHVRLPCTPSAAFSPGATTSHTRSCSGSGTTRPHDATARQRKRRSKFMAGHWQW